MTILYHTNATKTRQRITNIRRNTHHHQPHDKSAEEPSPAAQPHRNPVAKPPAGGSIDRSWTIKRSRNLRCFFIINPTRRAQGAEQLSARSDHTDDPGRGRTPNRRDEASKPQGRTKSTVGEPPIFFRFSQNKEEKLGVAFCSFTLPTSIDCMSTKCSCRCKHQTRNPCGMLSEVRKVLGDGSAWGGGMGAKEGRCEVTGAGCSSVRSRTTCFKGRYVSS